MKTRIGVIVMTVALAFYIFLVGRIAWALLTSSDGIAIAMGAALVVMPVIAVWGIARELVFGRAAERLGVRLEAEGGMPQEEVEVYTSGRVHRDAADALFPQYREAVVAAPEDWRAWYRLGLVYSGAGDTRRARHAIRQAITFSKRG